MHSGGWNPAAPAQISTPRRGIPKLAKKKRELFFTIRGGTAKGVIGEADNVVVTRGVAQAEVEELAPVNFRVQDLIGDTLCGSRKRFLVSHDSILVRGVNKHIVRYTLFQVGQGQARRTTVVAHYHSKVCPVLGMLSWSLG